MRNISVVRKRGVDQSQILCYAFSSYNGIVRDGGLSGILCGKMHRTSSSSLIYVILTPMILATVIMSLSPLPHKLIRMSLSGPNDFASWMVW